jgi:hypothetical protein
LADEFLDFPRPILHNTIYIGGLGIKSDTKGLQEVSFYVGFCIFLMQILAL